MYKEIAYNKYSEKALDQLKKGAFFTVKDGNEVNTMTIGWGTIGVFWGKPVFVAMVRYSRFTYEMLKNTDEFTVSIPLTKAMKEELAFCGSRSKREVDKIKECQMTLLDGKEVNTPIIDECDLHYECKIILRQKMEGSEMAEGMDDKFYSDDNYHVMFYGEIVSTYIKE